MKKTTEVTNLKAMDKIAISKELQVSQKKLTELRISQSFRKLKNYQEIANTRKKIARIWTILGEKIFIEESAKVSK